MTSFNIPWVICQTCGPVDVVVQSADLDIMGDPALSELPVFDGKASAIYLVNAVAIY